MRRAILALTLLTTLALAGCSADSGPAQVKVIAMHSATFDPSSVTIAKGTTLRFEAHDAVHTAQTADQKFATGDIRSGEHKDITNLPQGTHAFTCKFHSSMRLTVTVTA